MPPPVLIRVSGPDHPGITSALMAILDRLDAHIEDIEQIVIRRQLTLGIVARVDRASLAAAVHDLGTAHGVAVEIADADESPTERALGTIVTILATTIGPNQMAAIAAGVAQCGGNIDRIVRLSRYPVTSYELDVYGAPIEALRQVLVSVGRVHGVDLSIQPDGLGRRSRRLVVLDVDSTLIQDEVIDLMASEAGCAQEVAELTARAMDGSLDFSDALTARVALMAGLDTEALDRVRDKVRLTPGARTFVRTLKRMGFKVAVVSGGFTFVTDALAVDLGLDHASANKLEIVDGRLTGRLSGPIVDRQRKATILREIAEAEGIGVDATVAVGDGANDLDMLAEAGLGIAFNAKAVVRAAADTSVSVPYLDAVLFLLGVRRSEVEAADYADGAGPDGIRVPID